MSLQRHVREIPQLTVALWILTLLILGLLGAPHHAGALAVGALACSGLIWWKRRFGVGIFLGFVGVLLVVMGATEGSTRTPAGIYWKTWAVILMVACLGLIGHFWQDT